MLKGSIHQEYNSPVYAPNNRAPEYMKLKLTELKGEEKKKKHSQTLEHSSVINNDIEQIHRIDKSQ